MKNTFLCLCMLCATVFSAHSLFSQAVIPPSRFGFYGGLNINSNSPSIKMWRSGTQVQPQFIPFVQDSARITGSEMAFGPAFGLIGGFALSEKIHLSLRLGYNSLNNKASASQRVGDTTVEHDFSASMSTLEMSPVVEFYGLFGNLSLHPFAGLEFGLPLSTTYTHSATATGVGTTTTQTFATDVEVQNTSMRAAAIIGAGYTFRIDTSSWYIQPEISYRLPLTNVSSDADFSPWKVSQARLGINIFYGFHEKSAPPPPPTSRLSVSIDKVTSYDASGREVTVSQISLEDVRYNEMFPLLPYVFAGENTAQPSADLHQGGYDRLSGDFDPQRLTLDAIEVNKNLLNIIGARMKKYSNATLSITGTNDGKTEASNRDLAAARAAWAKDYLVNTMGIDGGRISTAASGLPSKASSSTDPDGVAENRRIELASNVPDVLAPLVITTDNQRIARPDVVVFHPRVISDDEVRSWTLTITQSGRVLREMSSRGTPSSISWAIKPNELTATQAPVDYELMVRNTRGDSANASGSIPVEYFSSTRKRTENLPDRSIDKYSLILFDFDKSTLTAENSRILEQMVLPSIRANSKVNIIGYTDRIGLDTYNAKLSADRAETVRAFLIERAKDATYTASGVGESSAIFNNDSPIGRQLSRTVQIIVETPHR